MTSAEIFVDHVADHTGLSHEHAEIVTQDVLRGLGAYLTDPQRAMIAQELPAELARLLGADDATALVDLQETPESLPALTLGHAREVFAGVCHALADELCDECLAELRGALPAELADMLASSGSGIAHHVPSPHGSTLAEGHPGSNHPLSEAHPSAQIPAPTRRPS